MPVNINPLLGAPDRCAAVRPHQRAGRDAQVLAHRHRLEELQRHARLELFDRRQPHQWSGRLAQQRRGHVDDELIDQPGGEQCARQARSSLHPDLIGLEQGEAAQNRFEREAVGR